MDGRALPAGELAFSANVAPQTASSHLAKLVAARLLSVETQGRHRYYRMANAEVGTAIEALGHLAPSPRIQTHQSGEWKTLRAARTCYNHLAGQFAVAIHNQFEQRGFLQRVLTGSATSLTQGWSGSKNWETIRRGSAWPIV